MPVASSYYVAIHTGKDYDSVGYHSAAGNLMKVFTDLLSDRAVVSQLTHSENVHSATTEVEACLEGEPRELVGKAVIDVMTEEKVKFDKPKLTKLVKEHELSLQWPQIKILKRLIED